MYKVYKGLMSPYLSAMFCLSQLNGSMKEPNISMYIFFFLPMNDSVCSISDVMFTGRRGVSDFIVLKYY